MTAAGFRKMLSTVGVACGLPAVHPHMPRHCCGFYMAHDPPRGRQGLRPSDHPTPGSAIGAGSTRSGDRI
jgi:hypothetical protein